MGTNCSSLSLFGLQGPLTRWSPSTPRILPLRPSQGWPRPCLSRAGGHNAAIASWRHKEHLEDALVPVLGCLGLVPEPSGAPSTVVHLRGLGKKPHGKLPGWRGCPRSRGGPLACPLSPGQPAFPGQRRAQGSCTPPDVPASRDQGPSQWKAASSRSLHRGGGSSTKPSL